MGSIWSFGAFVAFMCGIVFLAAAVAARIRRTGQSGRWLKRVAVAALAFIICIAFAPAAVETPTTAPEQAAEHTSPPAKETPPAAAKPAAPTEQPKAEQPPPTTVEHKSTAPADDVIVYVTDTGAKYHSSGCRHLAKSKRAVSLSWARKNGYEPCSVCRPPR